MPKKSYGLSRTIVAGDFNASNIAWERANEFINSNNNSERHYCRIKENRGRIIAKLMQRNKLNYMSPNKRCITCNNRCIDLVFMGNKAQRVWIAAESIKVNTERNQHHPVKIIARNKGNMNKCKTKTYHDLRRIKEDDIIELNERSKCISANWQRKQKTEQIRIMNQLCKLLYEEVIKIQKRTLTTKRARTKSSSSRTVLTRMWNKRYLEKYKRLMNKLARANSNSNNNNGHPRRTHNEIKKQINTIQQKIIMRINSLHNKEIYEHELWDRVRIATRHPSDHTETTIGIIKTTASINKMAKEKFPTIPLKAGHRIKLEQEVLRTNGITLNTNEIQLAINNIRNKKFTSPEGIKMNIFNIVANRSKDIIETVSRISFRTLEVPEMVKTTKGCLIPKKAANKYRIVHISSPMATILENIALHRLEFRLENNGLLSPSQYGFTALRGRMDLVARIIETACANNKNKTDPNNDKGQEHTTIISLDINGAFDNVSQDAIIDKLFMDLNEDPLKIWLAKFIIDRRISIEYKGLRSKTRKVQMGVPQGSALGPILFNYMINNIEEGLYEQYGVETLKYADDIFLIHKGANRAKLQTALDALVTRLNNIKLDINPEKCQFMIIKYGQSNRTPIQRYTIGGTNIAHVKSMNILGIQVTRTLQLDRAYMKHKLESAIERIHKIKQANIIHKAHEWRTIIESYLECHILTNNWPITAINRGDRNWCDSIMIRAHKILFDWPSNTPTKIIRYITGMTTLENKIEKIIQIGQTTEHYNSYMAIHKLFNSSKSGDTRTRALVEHTPYDISMHMSRKRRYHDPDKALPSPVLINSIDNDQLASIGPVWITIDRKQASIGAELIGHRVLRIKMSRHTGYQVAYFNTIAMIWDMAHNRDRTLNRRLLMGENDAILKALYNVLNHDWRVIQLRERLAENGWRIYTIEQDKAKTLRGMTLQTTQQYSIQQNLQPNNFDNWTRMVEEAMSTQPQRHRHAHNEGDNNDNNGEQKQTLGTIGVVNLQTPCLNDYRRTHMANVLYEAKSGAEMRQYETRLCKILGHNKIATWQNIPHNWIDGPKLLTLADMYTDRHGRLAMYNGEPELECDLCNRRIYATHPTIHRATDCPTLADKQTHIRALANKYPNNSISEALDNRMDCQRALRLLAECALKTTGSQTQRADNSDTRRPDDM